MKENMNYYLGENYITDLHNTLPLFIASNKSVDEYFDISNHQIDHMLNKIPN